MLRVRGIRQYGDKFVLLVELLSPPPSPPQRVRKGGEIGEKSPSPYFLKIMDRGGGDI